MLRADVREAQEVKRPGLPLSSLLATTRRLPAKLHDPRLFRMQLQMEFLQADPQVFQELQRFVPMLEADHKIVGVAHDDHITAQLRSSLVIYPEIQGVVQVDVGQKWADDPSHAVDNLAEDPRWRKGSCAESRWFPIRQEPP